MSPFLEIRKSQAFYKSAIDKMWECNVRCFSIAKCNQVQSAQLKHSICFCKSAAVCNEFPAKQIAKIRLH